MCNQNPITYTDRVFSYYSMEQYGIRNIQFVSPVENAAQPEQEERRGSINQKGSNCPGKGKGELFVIFRPLILQRKIK